MQRILHMLLGLAMAHIVGVCQVNAAEAHSSPALPVEKRSLLERTWDQLRFYENTNNPIIESFSLIGRYHGQYWNVNADQGNADNWENRRFYLGAEAEMFHQLKLQAQIKASEDFDPFYESLYQAYVKWSPSTAFSLAAGRLDYLFTGLERSVSSTKIVTFERGLLVNQLMPQEVVGALAEGKTGTISYRAGVFSGSIEDEFTHFHGGFGLVADVGCDLPLFYEKGSLHFDYLYNNGNPDNNAFKAYDHVVSLWHQGHLGAFGLGLDVTWGHGLGARPEVLGVTVLPTYVVARSLLLQGDALEAVLRYQFGISGDPNGLLLQKRYEQEVVPGGRGDRYHAFYAGLNYLIYGDRLKLMTGVEYSVMSDASSDGGNFDGWTWLAGVRLYF